jgi:hypothetical protein
MLIFSVLRLIYGLSSASDVRTALLETGEVDVANFIRDPTARHAISCCALTRCLRQTCAPNGPGNEEQAFQTIGLGIDVALLHLPPPFGLFGALSMGGERDSDAHRQEMPSARHLEPVVGYQTARLDGFGGVRNSTTVLRGR